MKQSYFDKLFEKIKFRVMKKKTIKDIKGVKFVSYGENYFFYIYELSDELKVYLRDFLPNICHGDNEAEIGDTIHSYSETLKEFLRRYEAKRQNQQIGLIGELMLHFLTRLYLDNFQVCSPFFNMEDGSVKKGFDIILRDVKDDKTVWFVESKAGEYGSEDKDSTDSLMRRFDIAYADLKSRLNDNQRQLWLNALNSARVAMIDDRDEKKQVIEILRAYSNNVAKEELTSQECSVILAATLFHDVTQKVDYTVMENKELEVRKKAVFKNAILIGIQKSTYSRIVDFLKSEAGK